MRGLAMEEETLESRDARESRHVLLVVDAKESRFEAKEWRLPLAADPQDTRDALSVESEARL